MRWHLPLQSRPQVRTATRTALRSDPRSRHHRARGLLDTCPAQALRCVQGRQHLGRRRAIEKIKGLYEIERSIDAEPAEIRRRGRTPSKLKILDFFVWADDIPAQASARSPLAEALRYAVKLKPRLLAYTDDGRLEIDNSLAENALRGICAGRKNWLFASADCGGERAAAMYSLIETAKLNGVNPQEWLADVLRRIGKGHPINLVDKLLPWNWKGLD